MMRNLLKFYCRKINKHIRELLKLFEKSSYIAVTATPFANIFILPEKNEDSVEKALLLLLAFIQL